MREASTYIKIQKQDTEKGKSEKNQRKRAY